ncbi:MAG: respiratory nitrate reductase subunit gamma [Desulfuromonadales bacterium]|nr:respiratory nitrate reductase subunit gamma [Desulfuromonadales bacterium]
MMSTFLYAIFPYLALALAVGVGLYRYFFDRFSWSSQSSQLLESRVLYWGSVSWHYPIVIILLAHLLAFLFPTGWGVLLGRPLRLYLLEATGLALALCALAGLGLLMLRRAMHSQLAAVSTPLDWIVLFCLLLQTATGILIAFTLRWGSVWYLHTAAPWLWSLLRLNPEVQLMTVLPLVVQVHAVNAFVLVALFPFSRLVHLVSIPITYLWRPPQVTIWQRRS